MRLGAPVGGPPRGVLDLTGPAAPRGAPMTLRDHGPALFLLPPHPLWAPVAPLSHGAPPLVLSYPVVQPLPDPTLQRPLGA